MNKLLKKQNGAITLYVSIVCLFVITVGITYYITSTNKQEVQQNHLNVIENLYNTNVMANDIYNRYIKDDIIPIYTETQLMKIGTNESIYEKENGNIYVFGTGKTYVLQSDLIITEDFSRVAELIKNGLIVFEGQGNVITQRNPDGSQVYYTKSTGYKMALTSIE